MWFKKRPSTQELVQQAIKEYIATAPVKEFLTSCFEQVPSYFWTVPASSGGKHHPRFAQGRGGLVRHTLMAVKIAKMLLQAYPGLSVDDQDEVYAALFLHDTLKQGYPPAGRTLTVHPNLPRAHFEPQAHLIPWGRYSLIMSYIDTHMGIWGPFEATPELAQVGERISPAELVHLCDYLASRKELFIR